MTEQPPGILGTSGNIIRGEIVGTTVAVGAVYLLREVAPEQTRKLARFFARQISKLRGYEPDSERTEALAQKMVDVTLMNVGGMANMTAQFIGRRMDGADVPFWHDVASVGLGRVTGTASAIMAMAAAEKYASTPVGATKDRLAETIMQVRSRLGACPDREITEADTRLADLVVKSWLQSAGGIPVNAATQSLFDRLVTYNGQER